MARENKSRYAILGVLSLGPKSGYDIKKTIEASLSNFWNESYGQIYPILKSLVAEGLATSDVQLQTGRPNRHVYRLTESGWAELRRWLERPIEHEVGRVEILLKLFFGRHLSVATNVRRVEEFRQLQSNLLGRYTGIERWLMSAQKDDPSLPYWLTTVSYGQHVSRALMDWCDETVERLQALEDTGIPIADGDPAAHEGDTSTRSGPD